MLNDLKLIRYIGLRHRAEMDRIRLLTLQTYHVMVMMPIFTSYAELDSILEHYLLKNA